MANKLYEDAVRFTVIMEREWLDVLNDYAASIGSTASREAALQIKRYIEERGLFDAKIEPLNSPRNRELRRQARKRNDNGAT